MGVGLVLEGFRGSGVRVYTGIEIGIGVWGLGQTGAYTTVNTTYNIQHTTYNIQHTTYNIQHITYNI
jgi:hypothetical protein